MTRQVNALDATLDPYDLEPGDVVAGSPVTSELSVTTVGTVEVGIWEITPGTVTDVEKDEVFVVLAGEGTVSFTGGEVVELGPGSVVRLNAGESTVWEIRSTLRKVYVV
jgi:uncharacterized cupin superfamily protein